MTDGTSQGLFIVVAIVIFGIFVVLAYILFEDTLSPALASMFSDATEKAFHALDYRGLTPTDEKYFDTEELVDGTLKITQYKTTEEFSDAPKDVVIPKEIKGKTVTIIGESSFYQKSLTSVYIPNTITKILGHPYNGNPDTYRGAFANNDLTKVSIPGSVTEIGTCAFRRNNIKELVFHEGLKIIGYESFTGNKLTSVNLPDSLTTIRGYSFAGNPLEHVQFGKSIQVIGGKAFRNTHMESFTIPKSVTSFGEYNFSMNPNLKEINIPEHLMYLFVENSPHLAKTVHEDNGITVVESTYSTNIVKVYK